jgi:uncharacterized protein with FMN-binding domain
LKRAAAATAGTVIALILILDYKSAPASLGRRVSITAQPPATTAPPAASAPPASTPSGTATPSTATPSTATPSTATPSTTAPAGAARQITGQVVDTQYGPVQVQITLTGNRIANIGALQLPSDRSRSIEISQYAAPILRQEVLTAQSAQIDVVSGASYTSQGYADSLQSALDQARQ